MSEPKKNTKYELTEDQQLEMNNILESFKREQIYLTSCGFKPDDKKDDGDFDTERIAKLLIEIPMIFTQRKSINKNISSYGLKHQIEHYFSKRPLTESKNAYCANGDFIIAMLLLGYRHDKIKPNYPNCCFNWTYANKRNYCGYSSNID
jgi:hypothetical protein